MKKSDEKTKRPATRGNTRHAQARIPAEMYDAMSHLAIQRGMSIQGIFVAAIKQFLAAPEASKAAEFAGYEDNEMGSVAFYLAHAGPREAAGLMAMVNGWKEMYQRLGKEGEPGNKGHEGHSKG